MQEAEESQTSNAVEIAVMSVLHAANAFFEDDGASGTSERHAYASNEPYRRVVWVSGRKKRHRGWTPPLYTHFNGEYWKGTQRLRIDE